MRGDVVSIELLKHSFYCTGSLNDIKTPAIGAECKKSGFGRTVYRITYPLRQLLSNLIMVPYSWTNTAVNAAWKSLSERSVYLKVPLTVLAGAAACAVSLTGSAVVSATVGFIQSIHKAIYETNMDELDTFMERVLLDPRHTLARSSSSRSV